MPPLDFALLMGAIAYAGAGGGQNLCQSNWIRDKGFGMGLYVPRLVSPVTGHEEAAASTGFQFAPTKANLARWRDWWRFANIEQASTFALVSFLTIALMSMLAYSTVFGREGLANGIDFLQVEGQVLKDVVGAVVRRAVLGDRRAVAVRLGDGHRRLHLAAGLGHAQDRLPARPRHLGQPDLLPAGLGRRGGRHRSSCWRASTSRSSCSCSRRASRP